LHPVASKWSKDRKTRQREVTEGGAVKIRKESIPRAKNIQNKNFTRREKGFQQGRGKDWGWFRGGKKGSHQKVKKRMERCVARGGVWGNP